MVFLLIYLSRQIRKLDDDLLRSSINKDYSDWLKMLALESCFLMLRRFNPTEAVDLYELANVLSDIVPENSTILTDLV